MIVLAAALLVLGLGAPLASQAGPNASTTIVLHALEGLGHNCGSAGNPCSTGINLQMEIGQEYTVYVYLRHYDNVGYIQTAFDWPTDWVLFDFPGTGFCCRTNCIDPAFPTSPGPFDGTLALVGDCLTGGTLVPVAWMRFRPTSPGCLTQIESGYPFGTHVTDCQGEVDRIPAAQRGSLCAGYPGQDVCDGPVPVEPTTWGRIKRTHGP